MSKELSEDLPNDRVDEPYALAVYGTLAPGELNYDVVADIDGDWRPGTIRGHYSLWDHGPYIGLPRVRLDPDGPEVDVMVLFSPHLPAHWDRLDDFEGPAYERIITEVTFTDRDQRPHQRSGPAWVYEADHDFDPADHGPGPHHGSKPPQ